MLGLACDATEASRTRAQESNDFVNFGCVSPIYSTQHTKLPTMAKGENSKKAAGNAKKAEVAAQKQAVENAKKAKAEDQEWQKGAKDNSKA